MLNAYSFQIHSWISASLFLHMFVQEFDTLKIPKHHFGTKDTLKKVICLSLHFFSCYANVTVFSHESEHTKLMTSLIISLLLAVFDRRISMTANIFWNIFWFCCIFHGFKFQNIVSSRFRLGEFFEQKCQEPPYSSITKRLNIHEEHFHNHSRMVVYACRECRHSRHIYSITFTRLQFLGSRNSIQS